METEREERFAVAVDRIYRRGGPLRLFFVTRGHWATHWTGDPSKARRLNLKGAQALAELLDGDVVPLSES